LLAGHTVVRKHAVDLPTAARGKRSARIDLVLED
jgi:hypothetical protein